MALELLDVGVFIGISIASWFILTRVFLKVAIKRSIHGFLKLGKNTQAGSVASRLDRNLLGKMVNDVTRPTSPIGMILSFFPETQTYMKKNPTTVIQMVEMFGQLAPVLTNLQPVLEKFGIGKQAQPAPMTEYPIEP